MLTRQAIVKKCCHFHSSHTTYSSVMHTYTAKGWTLRCDSSEMNFYVFCKSLNDEATSLNVQVLLYQCSYLPCMCTALLRSQNITKYTPSSVHLSSMHFWDPKILQNIHLYQCIYLPCMCRALLRSQNITKYTSLSVHLSSMHFWDPKILQNIHLYQCIYLPCTSEIPKYYKIHTFISAFIFHACVELFWDPKILQNITILITANTIVLMHQQTLMRQSEINGSPQQRQCFFMN